MNLDVERIQHELQQLQQRSSEVSSRLNHTRGDDRGRQTRAENVVQQEPVRTTGAAGNTDVRESEHACVPRESGKPGADRLAQPANPGLDPHRYLGRDWRTARRRTAKGDFNEAPEDTTRQQVEAQGSTRRPLTHQNPHENQVRINVLDRISQGTHRRESSSHRPQSRTDSVRVGRGNIHERLGVIDSGSNRPPRDIDSRLGNTSQDQGQEYRGVGGSRISRVTRDINVQYDGQSVARNTDSRFDGAPKRPRAYADASERATDSFPPPPRQHSSDLAQGARSHHSKDSRHSHEVSLGRHVTVRDLPYQLVPSSFPRSRPAGQSKGMPKHHGAFPDETGDLAPINDGPVPEDGEFMEQTEGHEFPVEPRPNKTVDDNPRALKRNKRLFGAMMGHLAGFRKQVQKFESSEVVEKRRAMERSVKQKASRDEEKMRIMRRHRAMERRAQDMQLKRELALKQYQTEAALLCAQRVAHSRDCLKYLKTKTWPPILWEPAVPCTDLDAPFDEQEISFTEWATQQELALAEEQAGIQDSAERRWAVMDNRFTANLDQWGKTPRRGSHMTNRSNNNLVRDELVVRNKRMDRAAESADAGHRGGSAAIDGGAGLSRRVCSVVTAVVRDTEEGSDGAEEMAAEDERDGTQAGDEDEDALSMGDEDEYVEEDYAEEDIFDSVEGGSDDEDMDINAPRRDQMDVVEQRDESASE